MTKKIHKNALVLGATGGVGIEVARCLGDAGYHVIGSCRTAAQARALVASGTCAQALRLSLDKTRSIESAFAELRSQGIDDLAALVNCAAVTQPRPLELTTQVDLHRTFEINLFGALRAVQLALPMLRAGKGAGAGRIVFISSTSGSLAVPLLGTYSASKFALEALADVLRRELQPWSIGVSLVIPGGIRTPMIQRQLAEIDADLAALKPGIEQDYAHPYRQHRRLIELAEKSAVTPAAVAADVLRALSDTRPKSRYLCGLPSQGSRALRRLMPDGLMDRLFDALPASKN